MRMLKYVVYGVLALSFAAMVALGQTAHYRQVPAKDDPTQLVALNDLQATPGAVDPALTKDQLCDKTFHTGTVRHVTQAMKVQVCKAYGAAGKCPSHQYEIDHLVSIELGGANDVKNLWPQPLDSAAVVGFRTKDIVENRAHAAVCAGQLTLLEAQQAIAADWYAFGLKYGWLKHKAFKK